MVMNLQLPNSTRKEQPASLLIFFLLVSTLSLLIVFSCDSRPDHETEQAWQITFHEALIEGYANFKGHFVDTDTSVYIFSYQLPPKLNTKAAFAMIRRQNGKYALISESATELVLRYPVTQPLDKNFEGLFNEFRFVTDERQGKVTVMFANLDTRQKLKWHQFYIKKLNDAHKKYTSVTH